MNKKKKIKKVINFFVSAQSPANGRNSPAVEYKIYRDIANFVFCVNFIFFPGLKNIRSGTVCNDLLFTSDVSAGARAYEVLSKVKNVNDLFFFLIRNKN